MGIKIGDRVEILSGTEQNGWEENGHMEPLIGTFGIVINDDGYNLLRYQVATEFDDDEWWFNEEDLKVILEVI